MAVAEDTQQPFPYMSENSVSFISERLVDLDILVEFGSGSSTSYFLRQLLDKRVECRFVSVERSQAWFVEVGDKIKKDFESTIAHQPTVEMWPWSMEKIRRYSTGESQTNLEIPPHLKRLPRSQRTLAGNPLRKLKHLLLKGRRPHDGRFMVTVGGRIQFSYELRSEPIKDQYGESPFKAEYIDAGLDPVRQLLGEGRRVRAGFVVDGGPRGDIVHAVLDMEEQYPELETNIYLLEAHRLIYESAIARRESGVFTRGSNRMLNGEAVYRTPRDKSKNVFWYGHADATLEELLDREMWHYSNRRPDV